MTYYYQKVFASTKTVFSEIGARQVKQLPIRIASVEKRELIVNLVDKMLSLNKKLNELGLVDTYETAKLKEEIKRIDDEIDNVVYDIYGLDESERKIIEASIK